MASARYTRNITPDAPEPTPAPMTPKQKRENFWFYYKWHVLGGALALLILGMFVKDVLFQTKADYTIGVLTRSSLPYGVAESLQQGFETLCDDRNGDGKVSVTVSEYVIAGEDAADAQLQMASVARLMGDIESGETMLFLTNDPEYFEDLYGIFAYNDGTTPPEGDVDWARLGVAWDNCPALAALDLGPLTNLDGTQSGEMQDYMQDFTLLLRIYEGSGIEGKKNMESAYQRAMEQFAQWTA